jgi:ArsR family metal-binding transcriptional regulator
VGRETEIDKCTLLIEPRYATNIEHIRTLLEYL